LLVSQDDFPVVVKAKLECQIKGGCCAFGNEDPIELKIFPVCQNQAAHLFVIAFQADDLVLTDHQFGIRNISFELASVGQQVNRRGKRP